MITQNAGIETGGGGGVVLGTGSNNYRVKNNFIAANLTAGNGGGIAHIGLSQVGVIDGNTVIFNESFLQAAGTNGGGIFIGGTPAAAGAVTPGSGNVEVTNNLIQGNAASGGDGGGVALLGFSGDDQVRLFNNMIANNVAGLAGGGIAIAGCPRAWSNPPGGGHRPQHGRGQRQHGHGGSGVRQRSAHVLAAAGRHRRARAPWRRVRHRQLDRLAQPDLLLRPVHRGEPCGTAIVADRGPPGPTSSAKSRITARPFWDLAVLGGTDSSARSSPSCRV